MSASIHINGIWRLDYNESAAHSLLLLLQYVIPNNSGNNDKEVLLSNVLLLLKQIQIKSSKYVSNLPNCMLSLRKNSSSNATNKSNKDKRGVAVGDDNKNNYCGTELGISAHEEQMNIMMDDVIMNMLNTLGKNVFSLNSKDDTTAATSQSTSSSCENLTASFQTIIGNTTNTLNFQNLAFDLLSYKNSYYYTLHRKHLLYILSNSSNYTTSQLIKEKLNIVNELFIHSAISMLLLDSFMEYLNNFKDYDGDTTTTNNPFSLVQNASNTTSLYSSSYSSYDNNNINNNANTKLLSSPNDIDATTATTTNNTNIVLKPIIMSTLSTNFDNTFIDIDEDYRSKHTITTISTTAKSASLSSSSEPSSSTTTTSELHQPKRRMLKTGAIVSLVGRAAFPCVCEISEIHASLFQDHHACVVADGIKWQSLYLVILGKYMLLAEPERRFTSSSGGGGSASSSSGNGRVVTSCQLSCLDIQKDKPTVIHTSSARRLLVMYYSFDKEPPGVFTLDTTTNITSNQGMSNTTLSGTGINNSSYNTNINSSSTNNNTIINHSRMDLWFEDEDSADSAYEALYIKINKAKSKRGKMLRNAFSKG